MPSATSASDSTARNSVGLLGARVLASLVLSELTEGIRIIALPLLVYGSTGSLTNSAIVAVCAAVPTVVVGVVGAPQVDRLSRQRIIVTANLVRAALFLVLPFAWESVGMASVMIVAFISASFGAIEQPALYASLPTLFRENYKDFVGKRTGLSFLTQAVSPAVGGALVGLIGAESTLLVCGGGYLVYSLLIATIRGFDPEHASRSSAAKQVKNSSALKEALKYAWNEPGVRTIFTYWFFSLMAVPIGVMSAIPYLTTVLDRSPFEYGIASTCYGAASVVGSIVAGKMKFPGGARRWLLAAGLLYGAVNLVMIFQPGYVIFCILWVLWGIAYGPEEVVGQVAFVRLVPEKMQGRMFALMTVVMSAGSMIGSAVVGPVSDHFGPTICMFVAGCVFIGATLYGFGFSKGAREFSRIDVT